MSEQEKDKRSDLEKMADETGQMLVDNLNKNVMIEDICRQLASLIGDSDTKARDLGYRFPYYLKQEAGSVFTEFIDAAAEKIKDDYSLADPLWDEVEAFVRNEKTVSAEMLQREFRVGYARACAFLDALERKQIIGPVRGNAPQTVLPKKDDI